MSQPIPCPECDGTGVVCGSCDYPEPQCCCLDDGRPFDPVRCECCDGTGTCYD